MSSQTKLSIGGLTPFTTIDFPGHLAAVVFCQGCPWRCSYCHNPHLLPARTQHNAYTWAQLMTWLESRRGLLDGVVFSGGEPLLQRALPQAIAEAGQSGFATALHTAGAYPERLAAALPDLDWVGFDIKAPFEDYHRITGVDNGQEARESLIRLLQSGTDYEIRCTVDTRLLDEHDLAKLTRQLASLGIDRLVLQPCRNPSSDRQLLERMVATAKTHLPQVELR